MKVLNLIISLVKILERVLKERNFVVHFIHGQFPTELNQTFLKYSKCIKDKEPGFTTCKKSGSINISSQLYTIISYF